MNGYRVIVVTRGRDLPPLPPGGSFFHGAELFRLAEQVPGAMPFMALALDGEDHVVGRLLAVARRPARWLPPCLFAHAHVYGQGEYAPGVDAEGVFGELLAALTRRLRWRCLYVEFSDLPHKMFGYRHFRREGYFPTLWQEIRNSLHSLSPDERLSRPLLKKLRRLGRELTFRPVRSEADLRALSRLLRRHGGLGPRRYLPPARELGELSGHEAVGLFVTCRGERVVGGCACLYSEGQALLWQLAAMGRRRGGVARFTAWQALCQAHRSGLRHLLFVDVGLPWQGSRRRRFALSFGGKPVSTYRWFRCSVGWVNRVLSWFPRG